MCYQARGLKAGRLEMVDKLPPERQAWLQKELRKWPQLLDHNLALLHELADPEVGDNEHSPSQRQLATSTCCRLQLQHGQGGNRAVAVVSYGHYRGFRAGTEAEMQDLSVDSLVVELEEVDYVP